MLRVSEKTIIVGIDIAKKQHWARITDYRGVDMCKAMRVENSYGGVEKLMNRIEKVRMQSCDGWIGGIRALLEAVRVVFVLA